METHDLPKKNILGLHARMEGLQYLERQILDFFPDCRFGKASRSEERRHLILRNTYDLIVTDIWRLSHQKAMNIAIPILPNGGKWLPLSSLP